MRYTVCMQFQIPQFLEVEDKLFGFLTIKQFLFLAGGAGMAFVAHAYLPSLLAVPLILVIIAISAAFAFVKINAKPFIFFVESFIRYLLSPRLYIWKKMPKAPKIEGEKTPNDIGVSIPLLSENKLRDIAWSLDIKEYEK